MAGFWRSAYRPFFLGAGLWAVIAPSVWLWPGAVVDPVFWHLHELMFGMGGAGVGGYLLTALPNWTGRRPAGPETVAVLVLAWGVARLGMVEAGDLRPGVGAVYFVGLSAVLLRAVMAARAWRRVPLALAPLLLGLADAALLWQNRQGGIGPHAPVLTALAYATLIGGIGGRAIPAFVRSWHESRGMAPRVVAPAVVNALGVIGTAAGAALVLGGYDTAAGVALMLTGAGQIARLAGWSVCRSLGHPPLAMLLAAWVWLGAGLMLAGLALARPDLVARGDALHGLTMGAMGTMIPALAGRAAMGRVGAELRAPVLLQLGFALIWTAALVRVGASLSLPAGPDPVRVAAGLWMVGWGLFLVSFVPALIGPAPHPVLSARRPKSVQ